MSQLSPGYVRLMIKRTMSSRFKEDQRFSNDDWDAMEARARQQLQVNYQVQLQSQSWYQSKPSELWTRTNAANVEGYHFNKTRPDYPKIER
jgi:hypothetical protein